MEDSIRAKNTLIIIIAIMIFAAVITLVFYFGSDSMLFTSEIEKPSFTIELPKSFYEDSNGDFIGSNNGMYVTFDYYDNEIMLNTEGMVLLYESSYYDEGEIYTREKVIINGVEVWQMQYNMICQASDDTENYYAGVFTIFPVGNEFLVVDAYEWLGETNSDYSSISNRKMKLIKKITSTVQITNTEYNNTKDEALWINADKLKLKITSNWYLDEDDEYGFFDYGYFVSYRYDNFRMWIDIYEYNEQNVNDLHEILESKTKDSTYTSMGEGFLAGERALLYSYNAYGESPYEYGAIAISKHFIVDMYFYSYNNEYTLPYDTARNMLNYIMKTEYK